MPSRYSFFFFNDTATTEIYTLSLHDALPICLGVGEGARGWVRGARGERRAVPSHLAPRTSHLTAVCSRASSRSEEHTSELQYANISYAVFCLKKKNT